MLGGRGVIVQIDESLYRHKVTDPILVFSIEYNLIFPL